MLSMILDKICVPGRNRYICYRNDQSQSHRCKRHHYACINKYREQEHQTNPHRHIPLIKMAQTGNNTLNSGYFIAMSGKLLINRVVNSLNIFFLFFQYYHLL